ncbi:MAG: ABC transporter substrate-binding protein [Fusicatenibacter sp.]|nr:ABC transporter substrate-binding protein [Lachnospiraceae bacterium]MDY2938904.1 ABC transporter substrate-binding protein [Fusicatenibacter sp.]
MKRKLVSLLLVLTVSASMVACGSSSTADSSTSNSGSETSASSEDASDASADDASEAVDEETETAGVPENYDQTCTEIYEEVLGEFYDTYMDAKEVGTISERFAKMAIAEAKLMESGVLLPTTSQGGRYALSRVAPYTVDYVLWGGDQDRFHQALVTTELIKTADRNEMKEKWGELKGTGTYEEWAKNYLTEKGYTIKDTYNYIYTADPVVWDALATSRAVDGEALVNTYDGLMEYDVEGVQQPALAVAAPEVSEDGLTYTFKIREGVEWVDSQGRKVADLVADDFVAGMQHMMDAQGGLEYLVQGVIKNASEYIAGEVTDFSEVGVKALDDYTLEYTLEAPCSYFETMLGYSVFAPMSRAYYQSQGGKFGIEYDSSAADYTYGKDANSIAYCGPYVITNATEKNTIVFKANESYWNKDNINIKTLTWLYNDGQDVSKSYNDVVAGTVDGANLTSATVETAKKDGLFDEYSYVTSTNATSFMNFYNLNRNSFANVNDGTTAASAKSEEDIARTAAAIMNVHFRRALSFATDRASMNAQKVGEELKYAAMRNCYTPGNFVELDEDTVVSINGTDTTFPAGTRYGEVMQAQLDADGVKITVWDPEAEEGIGSSDGFDGWYNVDNAVEELNQAIEELAAEGITIDESNPIQIDFPYPSAIEQYANSANAYKQSVENALGGKIVINLIDTTDADGWYYAGYYTDYGYEANYDTYDVSGWGPDYGDPSTYLDTFLPDYAGYMVKCIGLY